MNKLSLSKSKLRRKENMFFLMSWACWAYELLPTPVADAVDTLWYKLGVNETWDKHASKLTLIILILAWYLSAIFAITTSKMVMLKIAMPYTLCAVQFLIASIVTLTYSYMWPYDGLTDSTSASIVINNRTLSMEEGGAAGAAGTSSPAGRLRRDRSGSNSASGDSSGHGTSSTGDKQYPSDDADQEAKYRKQTREPPSLAWQLFRCGDKQHGAILYKIAVSYTCGFMFTNMAFSVVTTSFAETVKSGEPLSSVVMAYFVLREIESISTYMCLIPICVGVACSCLHDDSFNAFGFSCAALSNLMFSMRAVYAKSLMQTTKHFLDETTLFGYVSIIGLCLLLPVSLYIEGASVYNKVVLNWNTNYIESRSLFLLILFANGLAYTCYNAMSFLVLTRTNLITHAVLNCVRRVFVIIFTSMFFDLHVSKMNLAGVGMAVAGVMAFAYFKSTSKKMVKK